MLSGSFAVAGRGTMRVTKVGADAYAATLAEQASTFTMVHSQIRADIDRVLRYITWALIPISILLAVTQLIQNESTADAISGTVAGVIAMIPEGLVLLTSVAFAVGVVTLGRKGCLVQELGAVEGLARVDVVCADKTGTLTEDRMEVVELVPLGGRTRRRRHARRSPPWPPPTASRTRRCGPSPPPTATPPGWTSTATAAFSSARKWSGVSFGADGNWVLGAPEVLVDAGDDALRRRRASGPTRACACCCWPAARTPSTRRAVRSRSTRPALVVLAQAVRPDSASTLEYFRQQGVTVKVISGDDPRTVGAIASRLGPRPGRPPRRRPVPARRRRSTGYRGSPTPSRATRCSAASPRTRSARWSGRCRPAGAPWR